MINKTEATGNISPHPQEGKHSPLPWRWEGNRASGYLLLSSQGSFGEVYICGEPKNCTARADAELICTAVNLHEKLVAALEESNQLLEFVAKEIKYKNFDFTDKMNLFSQIARFLGKSVQALAEAQEKSK